MQRVIRVGRDDSLLEEISANDVFALVRTEQINGEHSLEITTSVVLPKETRLLTQGGDGKWREWVVMGEDAEHASGRSPIGTYYAVWSLQHDMAVTTVDKMPGTQTPVRAALALDDAISGTERWARGTVTQTTTGGASMWYKSGWEALSIVVDVWGGELDATIEVDAKSITGRKVDLYSKMGDQTARRRFDWGHDLTGIRRKVEEAPVAVRIIPRGKGEETKSGGYGRKIDIKSVNSGVEWLQNNQTAPLYRLSDGSGGWEYPTVVVENGDIETPADLKKWAQGVLEDYTTPRVTYDGDVLQLARAGLDPQGVALGDAIQCVDRGFSEEGLRITGRVTAMRVNELDDNDVRLTVGYLTQGIAGRLNSITKIGQAVADMNGGTLTTADYLNSLLARLNGDINASGGYTYITEGQGIRTYDKAVTDPLVGAEADKVTEIKGGTIRIADSRNAQGEWEWRTVFVSGHIAADMVTAAQLTTGYIRSADGKSYWDLDSNRLVTKDADLEGKVTATSGEIGGMTIAETSLNNDFMTLRDNSLIFRRRSDKKPCGAVVGVKANSGTVNGILVGSVKPRWTATQERVMGLTATIDMSDDGEYIEPADPFLVYTTATFNSILGVPFIGGRMTVVPPTEFRSDLYVRDSSNETKKGLTADITVGGTHLVFAHGILVNRY